MVGWLVGWMGWDGMDGYPGAGLDETKRYDMARVYSFDFV